jgi:hypothetical protein
VIGLAVIVGGIKTVTTTVAVFTQVVAAVPVTV